MTGLINELFTHLNRNVSTNERIIESQVQKAHDEGIMKTIAYLRQQAKTGNIAAMLDDERLILTHSLKFSANSAENASVTVGQRVQIIHQLKCLH
jgi:hypothetical protein